MSLRYLCFPKMGCCKLSRAADRHAYSWLWKHCLFSKDCLGREKGSIYSWFPPYFASDALHVLLAMHVS